MSVWKVNFPRGGVIALLLFFLFLTRRWIWWFVNATQRLVFPPQRDPVHSVEETGRIPGLFRTGAENFFPTGIRSPDRDSLYTDYTTPSHDERIEASTCRRSLLSSSSGKSKRPSVESEAAGPHQTISYRLNCKALYPRELETSL